MELVYVLKGLDCPHCSAKIEKEVAALEQISEASVNLMQQTLTVRTAHAAEDIGRLIEDIVHKHEPDVAVIAKDAHDHAHSHTHAHAHAHCGGHCCDHAHEHEHEHAHEHGHSENRIMIIRILAGTAVFAAGAWM